jgi:hypothetical protein
MTYILNKGLISQVERVSTDMDTTMEWKIRQHGGSLIHRRNKINQ